MTLEHIIVLTFNQLLKNCICNIYKNRITIVFPTKTVFQVDGKFFWRKVVFFECRWKVLGRKGKGSWDKILRLH